MAVNPYEDRLVWGMNAERLEIDWTRCDGHGLCAALLPEAIRADDWGYPIIDQRRVAAQPANAVKRAVACCPALALRLERAG